MDGDYFTRMQRLMQMGVHYWGDPDNNIFYTIQSEMITKLKSSTAFRRQFEDAPDDTSRVALVLEEDCFKSSCLPLDRIRDVQGTTGFSCKWPSRAFRYRHDGNEHYYAKEYHKAIKKYSSAIQYAPAVGSPVVADGGDQRLLEELPFGYGNRSVVYFVLKQYQFALEDIDAALAHGYARYKPSFAILAIKCFCLASLGRDDEVKTVLEEAKTVLEELGADPKAKADRLQHLEKMIKISKAQPEESIPPASTISSRHLGSRFKAQEKCTQLSKKVAIEAHKGSPNGLRLVAVEEIKFGEILALTLPYVSVLSPDFDSDYCHHCCLDLFRDPKNFLRPQHCPNCSAVLFCSEQCRTSSWNAYHRYECGNEFALVPSNGILRLALRLLLMHQQAEILQTEEKLNSTSTSVEDPVNYLSINRLMPETGKLESYEEMLKSTITVCIYIYLLKQKGYFTSAPSQCTESWAGAVLLRHSRQLACNWRMFQLALPLGIDGPPSTIYMPLPSDYINICPTFGLLNHCCTPNGQLRKINEREGAILAMRSIAPGEEITMSVGDITVDTTLFVKLQKKKIKLEDDFECPCTRCAQDRRNKPAGIENYWTLACTACGGLIQKDADSESYHCTGCHLKVPPEEYLRRYTLADQLNTEHDNVMITLKNPNQPISSRNEALASLKQIYERAKTLFHGYQLDYYATDLVMYHVKMNQLQTAVDYAEEHLQLTAKCYGEESVEMMQLLEEYIMMIEQDYDEDDDDDELDYDEEDDAKQMEKMKKREERLEVIKDRFKELEEREKKLKQLYYL